MMKKSTDSSPNIVTPPATPPSKNKGGVQSSYVPSRIEIMKYGYKTPTKKPFELPDKLEVTPTHITPSLELMMINFIVWH